MRVKIIKLKIGENTIIYNKFDRSIQVGHKAPLLLFPHGESTSWNFPAKIKNSLRLIPSFDMMSKFPESDHSCRRRYVNKLLAERKKNKNKETSRRIVVFRVEYL